MSTTLKRYNVLAARPGNVWVSIGKAYANRDGTIEISIDSLPIDGKLKLHEAVEDGKTERSQKGGGGE